ncbi:MAG TPA: pirin family protein [Oscillatoriales cyanobacterium M59_W2019_021]|nr:MAG: pirin family protein [Cyanobacteria bacterium J055]HIK32623.1 pirin family protein [Oscillatoriales cyanobacterium M4454_W2019_049]HIK50626.1 pirin family protein [Oscillatoriales cyanobacterium M59_W2019_021]
MIVIRKAEDRGHANYGWLDSYHSFSFANYYDPHHMGFRQLRVINEDRVSGGGGFDAHPHRDMEIITYVVDGALEHRDSTGNNAVIRAGEVQRMSAGMGIAHSEYNHSQTDPVHLLQIWILPDRRGLQPSYEQRHYSEAEKRGNLRLIVSPDDRENALKIHQDVNLYATVLESGESINYPVLENRYAWIQVVKGEIEANDRSLKTGDGAALYEETQLQIKARSSAELLLFDLA